MLSLCLGFILTLFVNSAYSQKNPFQNPNTCGASTCNALNKFNYQPGTQQVYNYYVDIRNLFNGSSTNQSTLFIEAQVTLDFISECDGLLSLSNIKLSETLNFYNDPSDDEQDSRLHPNMELFSKDISRYSLRFSFQDGIITELCPMEDESTWVLNFKRGLLSMLHNTMRRFDLDHSIVEHDVHGSCDTVYRIKGANGTSLLIEKTKDLNSCLGTSKLHSFLQSSTFKLHSNSKNDYLLKSSSKCELSIDHQIYNEIKCEEIHVFQPFANKAAGALTMVKQILLLHEESNLNVEEQPSIERRTSLQYDKLDTPKLQSGELKTSRDLLKQLCKLDTDTSQAEFTDVFTKFVYSSRILSQIALSSLYSHAGTICLNGKLYMLDALPYINSAASLSLMKDIVINMSVTDDTLHEWMTSVAFISHPNEEMLKSAAILLDYKKNDSAVALSIAALTHTFCLQNVECNANEEVNKIINILQTMALQAYRSKSTERLEQETIIVSLKALANIGTSTESFKVDLIEMINDVSLNVGVRVVAVETLRRFPCEEFRSNFQEIFKDSTQDSEIRIASYLQIMRCPNYMVIRGIRNSLLVEEVNQVGTFVWSHLHNLMKSSSPNRVEIQSLLSNIELTKKFSSDIRKFSHNFEGSFFSQDFNVGASCESNIIFSTSSYIPRSSSLNISVDLFGESVNIFEVGSRIEGFEHYLEKIFGSTGNLNAKSVKKKFSKMRWPRDTNQQNYSTHDLIDLPAVITNNFNKPKVSLGFKVFGNEIKYKTFEGEEEIIAGIQQFNAVEHLKKILSGKEIDYKKTGMFLDSKYIIPSSAGLPITLNAVGTSSINVKLHGSLEAANFMKTKVLDLNGNIRPSAAVNIIGTMSVDAYYANTGIRLKTNMHTSSAIEGSLKIRGAGLISIKIGLPKEHNEIFAAHSELVVIKNQVEEFQKGLHNQISESICSWPILESTLGLKICTYYKFPNVSNGDSSPLFLLAGPTAYKMSLLKTDISASNYIFEYKWMKTDTGSVISLTYDTPGSVTQRVLGVNLTLNTQNHDLTLLLRSSVGTLLARGKYKNSETEKSLQLVLDVDEKKHLDAIISLERQDSRYGYTYVPKIYLGVNGERVAEFQGTLKWVSKKGISQCDVDLKFQTKRLTSKVFGYISKSDASIGTNLKFDYKFLNTREQRILLDFSLANRSTRTIVAIIGNARLDTTAYQNFNFDAVLKFQRAAGRMECKLEVNNNDNLEKLNPNRISMVYELKHKTKQDGSSFDIAFALNRTSTDFDMGGAFSYYISGPKTDITIKSKYAKDKEMLVTAYWIHPRSLLQHYEGLVSVSIPSFTPFNFGWKIQEKHHLDYDVEFSATWFNGQLITAVGIYHDRSTAKTASHHLKLVLRSPNFEDTDLDVIFNHDDMETKLDIKANYNKQDYEIFFKHTVLSAYDISSQVRLKLQAKVYSVSTSLQLQDKKQILLEIHIDQLRDIQLALWADNKSNQVTAGVEFKWDANRDPNQKLVLTISAVNAKLYNYDANFGLSFPGRIINGIFAFHTLENHLSTLVHLAWSPTQAVSFKLSADYKLQLESEINIKTEVITPFENWSKIYAKFQCRHVGNFYVANSTIRWNNNQYVSVELFKDYAISTTSGRYEFTSAIQSSFEDFPTFSISCKHSYNATKLDTSLHISYRPKTVIAVKSSWYVTEGTTGKNFTGTITLISPFVGYTRGLFVSRIHMSNKHDIRGVAEIDLDHRKYTASIEGHYQKLSSNMFVFNITTPIDKFSKLSGQLGYLEHEKHLAAFVQHSTATNGLEIKFLINSFTNFDIKLFLGTPIEFLSKLLLIGNVQPQMIEFRVGWNSLLAGCSAVWRFANITDFEYLFKVYTPIEGFEENGIVAKLIYKNGLDFEASGKLADGKVGLLIVGKPKPTFLNEMGIKTQSIYNRNLGDIEDNEGDSDGGNDYEDETEEPINWTALIELDVLVYPTMKGTLDIEQKGNMYLILSTFTLPDGMADLKNEFHFIDYFTMQNKLYLTLPYNNYKTITSNYDLQIVVGQQFKLTMDFNYLNGSNWINTDGSIHYTTTEEDGEQERITRDLMVNIHTPFKRISNLDLRSTLKSEMTLYGLNFELSSNNNSDIQLEGSSRFGGGLFFVTLTTHVTCPFIIIPQTTFFFKKDFTTVENKIELYFDMLRSKPSKFNIVVLWKFENVTNFKADLNVVTPIRGMEKVELNSLLLITNNNGRGALFISLHPLILNGSITIQNTQFHTNIIYEFKKKRKEIVLESKLLDSSPGIKEIHGNLKVDGTLYIVTGSMELSANNIPHTINIAVKQEQNLPFNINFKTRLETGGKYITSSITQGDQFINLEMHTSAVDSNQLNTHLLISTSNKKYTSFEFDMQMISGETQKKLAAKVRTPFQDIGNPSVTILVNNDNKHHTAQILYHLKDIQGTIDGEWCWIWMDNMSIKLKANYQIANLTKSSSMQLYYINPERSFTSLQLGGDVNLNNANMANVQVNIFFVNIQNLKVDTLISLLNLDVYTTDIMLHSNKEWNNIEYYIKHHQKTIDCKYGSSGKLVMNPGYLSSDIGFEWHNQKIDNQLTWKHMDNEQNLHYTLHTPKYIMMDTFTTNFNYIHVPENRHHIKSQVFYPANTSIFYTVVDFKEFGNMNATINVATPFKTISNVGSNFKSVTNVNTNDRYLQVFWPSNSAYIDSKCTIATGPSLLERNVSGILLIEVPLTTIHTGKIDYNYSIKPGKTTGVATAAYNTEKILDGKYNCLSESRAGYDKDMVFVELENKFLPVGVMYTHEHEYNPFRDDINFFTMDFKRLEAYNLRNHSGFNMTGEMVLRTTYTGQEIIFTAIHANRTIKLWTDYDILDQEFKQHSKFELGPTVWIGYDINIVNKTKDDNTEAQVIQIDISYPRRNFTALGSYNISNLSWVYDASLTWDEQKKTIAAALDWKQHISLTSTHQELELQIRHPSFENKRGISILGEFKTDDKAIADVRLTVDYSNNPEQKLELNAILAHHSHNNTENFTCTVMAKHPATNLHLYSNAGVFWRPKLYYIGQQLDYKRTYLPMQSRETFGRVDFDNHEIELKKKSLRDLSYFWSKYRSHYPLYTADIVSLHGADFNATGKFYLNFKEKLTRFDLNMTEDGSQSLQMVGYVPDARGATLDIWRKYDDFTIDDVSFFLRLNHSRLLVSRLYWRPEIKKQLQKNLQETCTHLYKDFIENTDYWRQYIRSEIADAIADVWQDSKPLLEDFLGDLRDLKTVEEDIEDLKKYLNESYNANDFYIHDIISFGVYFVDELAIKSHIESLPQFVNELWEVMGESGQKIQKGLVWVIETIKTYYKNATEFINGILQGDQLEHVSQTLAQMLEKYDSFIKDLHVSIIRYIENLWNQASVMLVDSWQKLLAVMQPTFLKIIHLAERLIWDTSKDFLDFLYVQKRELLESPYFGKFSNLSYDIDRIYKDITNNNAIASIYKYTVIVWNFLNDKLFKLIPFGKEIEDIVLEVLNELKELKKLPAFQHLVSKETEIYEKIKWFYTYFNMHEKIGQVLRFAQFKLMDLTRTALDVDNRHREAKTNFIFNTIDGVIYIEQKLPMSWHAFNETPKFQEIPEYKVINDVQSYFVASKTTFWSLYYDYKPYTDPSDWLPPFKAQALLAGSHNYVTFDRTFYNFSGGCSYLLASDFVDHNFTIVISYDDKGLKANELLLFVDNTTIHINILKSTIQLNSSEHSRLPLEIEALTVYQESDIVTVESASGFMLQCNLRFDVCILEVSGWYFGKTAGLFGTMNNEPSDDLLTSDRRIVNTTEINTFANSWMVNTKCSKPNYQLVESFVSLESIADMCDMFFIRSVSPLATCFTRVPKQPFLNMCLHSSSEKEACTSAVAYMKLCAIENTPLRIPEACVKCSTLNGTIVSEGEFVRFEGDLVPKSTDVVFIVEAKECNKDLRTNLTLDSITELLHKELSSLNITQNRYSVVVFGGNGVYDKPRSITIDSRTFTDYKGINSYLDNIPIGKGNSDIFAAIVYGTKLIFRPGVSKTFILLPCTDCHESNMKLDYAILHQLLLENDITLHILMKDDFTLQKDRANKIFFGIDRSRVFTKKDVKELRGDAGLLKQIRLPKSTLGFCTSLALETNGSLFSATKIQGDKKSTVKRFATVFSKRIAYSAMPSKCQMCECTAPNTGVSYMECFPCSYPTPANTDYGLNEDETLTILQPTPIDEDIDYT